MEHQNDDRHARAVRLHTVFGLLQGNLLCSPVLRTLDDLNLVARRFVTLHQLGADSPDWVRDGHPLVINKDSILFVVETRADQPMTAPRADRSRFTRAPLMLRVGEFALTGFVHVPPGGDPMNRLNQQSHNFIALTTVNGVGPEGDFEAPFVAINRAHILAAQQFEEAGPVGAADRNTSRTSA